MYCYSAYGDKADCNIVLLFCIKRCLLYKFGITPLFLYVAKTPTAFPFLSRLKTCGFEIVATKFAVLMGSPN